MTLENWPDANSQNQGSKILLRLEHIFEAQEDKNNMSKPVSIKLEGLFKAFDISSVEEVTLGKCIQNIH